MNLWIGIGNLTRDPEMAYTEGGIARTRFSIAINQGKDKDGNERDPLYMNCVAWEKLAENIAEYTRKGKKVCVQGALSLNEWTDREDVKHKDMQVRVFTCEFLSPRERDEDRPRDDDRPPRRDERPSQRRTSVTDDPLDTIPF